MYSEHVSEKKKKQKKKDLIKGNFLKQIIFNWKYDNRLSARTFHFQCHVGFQTYIWML